MSTCPSPRQHDRNVLSLCPDDGHLFAPCGERSQAPHPPLPLGAQRHSQPRAPAFSESKCGLPFTSSACMPNFPFLAAELTMGWQAQVGCSLLPPVLRCVSSPWLASIRWFVKVYLMLFFVLPRVQNYSALPLLPSSLQATPPPAHQGLLPSSYTAPAAPGVVPHQSQAWASF